MKLRDNLFSDKSKNCVIEVQYSSDGSQEHDSNRYINPWTGETVCELK